MANEEQVLVNLTFRACLNCGIVKSFAEFWNGGCPNCEKYVKFKYNLDKVVHCTTITFRDLYVLPEGFDKWGTRFRPVERVVLGLYAYRVVGSIPYRFMYELQSEERNAETGEHCL